jgi:hypothetical protein
VACWVAFDSVGDVQNRMQAMEKQLSDRFSKLETLLLAAASTAKVGDDSSTGGEEAEGAEEEEGLVPGDDGARP